MIHEAMAVVMLLLANGDAPLECRELGALPSDVPEIAQNPVVRGICWALLREARYGFAHTEQAAFLIRTDTGTVAFLRWPAMGEENAARWEGALPHGAVAIVHTHPNFLPMPSNIDIRTAQHSKVPVYVITAFEITRTSGGSPQVVVAGDWKPGEF